MAPVTAVDGVCCFCKTSLSLTRPASQNKAKHLLGCCSDFQLSLALQAHWAWQSLPWQNVVSHGLQVVPSIATMPPWGVWLICHPMDVAQEAHFSNRDTLDSCQDGKPIRDVSTQSAKAPQSRGFLFSGPRFSARLIGARAPATVAERCFMLAWLVPATRQTSSAFHPTRLGLWGESSPYGRLRRSVLRSRWCALDRGHGCKRP